MSLSHYVNELTSTWKVCARESPAALADDGVPKLQQLWELILLRSGAGKITAEDYYKLRLYRQKLPLTEKRQYMSNQAIPPAMVGRWKAVADDKLLTYSILSGCSFRIPTVYAICHPLRSHGRVTALRAPLDVAAYLRSQATYPFIIKPIRGMFSKDVMLVEGLEPHSNVLQIAGKAAASVDEISARCFQRRSGYLLQEQLRPHVDIRQQISDRICTLRIIVLSRPDEPRVMMAVWKIALGGNLADNYWRPGNLLAALDQETGEVVSCSTGLGPNYRVVERHPASGIELRGFRVPCYREAIDLALRASHAFCDIPMQAWDIAVTDEGPIPLEVNVVGSLFIPQIAKQRGLLAGSFNEFLKAHRGGDRRRSAAHSGR